jgi:hypothetical protein
MTTYTFTVTGSPQLNTDVATANGDPTDTYIIYLTGGSSVTGSAISISSNTTIVQTAQVTFSAATVVNLGTYDVYYSGTNTDIESPVLGISSDTASTFTNEGTFEQTVSGSSYGGTSIIDVDFTNTATGTLSVAGGDEDLLFDGATNSFSGTYVGGGMIDYGDGINTLYTIDYTLGACTTSFGTVEQDGVLTLSTDSTLLNYNGATWNLNNGSGFVLVDPSQSAAEFTDYGKLVDNASGTTVMPISTYFQNFGSGLISVASGSTLAFNGLSNQFYGPITGTGGTFSLGGGGTDSINSSTTISTSAWTITDAGTDVTLNETLTYAGTFLENSGTTLNLNDDLTLSNATIDGSVIGSSAAEIIMASGSNLQIGNLANFNASIGGFANGDILTVDNTNGIKSSNFYGSSDTTSLVMTDNGAVVGTLELTGGNYTNATVNSSGQIALCFMRGTKIRTPDGEIAVETLQRGDPVSTVDGLSMPVAWIGRQTVSTRFIDPLRVLPIRIKQGALGDNIPSRDLLLSPDHAILIGDVLIQAGALLNGVSIVRESNVPETFTYYHVELDDHSLIFAEDTPAETFIDNVERLTFDNWQEHETLYPGGKPILEMRYPRAKAYRQVPRSIRDELMGRTGLRVTDKRDQDIAA